MSFVRYGTRLGDLKNKQSTHTADPGTIFSVLVAQLVDRLGGDGFWEQDYGWGVRVRRHFGARGMSSVRYTVYVITFGSGKQLFPGLTATGINSVRGALPRSVEIIDSLHFKL